MYSSYSIYQKYVILLLNRCLIRNRKVLRNDVIENLVFASFVFVLLFVVDYVLEKHWCKSKKQVMGFQVLKLSIHSKYDFNKAKLIIHFMKRRKMDHSFFFFSKVKASKLNFALFTIKSKVLKPIFLSFQCMESFKSLESNYSCIYLFIYLFILKYDSFSMTQKILFFINSRRESYIIYLPA